MRNGTYFLLTSDAKDKMKISKTCYNMGAKKIAG